MKAPSFPENRTARSGIANVSVALVVTVLLILGGALLMTVSSTSKERSSSAARYRALLLADSGISFAVRNLVVELEKPEVDRADNHDIGSEALPVTGPAGEYWVDVADEGDNIFRLQSFGRVKGDTAAVEAVVEFFEGDVYTHAIFAGNESESSDYTLEFGGGGSAADQIDGDIYSGGDVIFAEDAAITGSVTSAGKITGVAGQEDTRLPIPKIEDLNYEVTADFNVADMFSSASYESNSLGGSAWQMPEASPAHIFRKNPSNRTTETTATAKDDYFLEDPYESANGTTVHDGRRATHLSLSGVNGESGPLSDEKIFYIDGNLWLHNLRTKTFTFGSNSDDGTQVTFVVKGNIYFADNIFYGESNLDGVAFVAMKDADVGDSGNIYFGDPVFGTLGHMQGILYAENNFYDISLDPESEIEVDGVMIAGDKIMLDRTAAYTTTTSSGSRGGDDDDDDDDDDDEWGSYGGGATTTVFGHTKLKVNFDDRIATGVLGMPGLPNNRRDSYAVRMWRKIAAQ